MASDKIKLKGAPDWEAWTTEFQIIADAAHLWEEKINPKNAEALKPFLTMPTPPNPQNYEKRIMPSQQPPAGSTRGISTGPTAEAVDYDGRPSNSGEMTTSGRIAFGLDQTTYKFNKELYEKEDKNVMDLKKWISTTISPHLMQTCCPTGKGIDVWYAKLKAQVGISDAALRDMAKDRYQAAIKPLARPPKDMSAWVTEWEERLAEAKKNGVGRVQHATDWFEDFDRAIRGFSPAYRTWAQTFAATNTEAIDNDTLAAGVLSNGFRAEMRREESTSGGPRKFQKGAHGAATFDGEPPSEEEDRLKAPATEKKRAPSKRRYTGGSKSGCRACGNTGHALDKCWYAFPDQAFDGWTPREFAKKKMEEALKKDDSLQAEIDKLKKRKKPKKTGPRKDHAAHIADVDDQEED
ncbi:hypothetical protein C8A00DRAFT_17532 [Chaetomidium leptoderma]|uniref:Uncharacterized protein n=1 Tax=Chaetomidium leptoderma TaxID=669021 RepID=A0AAN6VGE3_9PEZI|nr:hypothetical protein C8A00DRAFT_17532 [Chaetomidium leptoderma]